MDLINLGKTLRNKRNLNNLSSLDAAKLLKLSATYYSRLENGKERPSRELLDKIAADYNIPPEDKLLLEHLAGYATSAESKDKSTTSEKPTEIQIKLDPEKHQILFSDAMFISVSENGVVFNFGQHIGPTNEQQIVSRVGVSLGHAKKISKVLVEQINKAEKLGVEN